MIYKIPVKGKYGIRSGVSKRMCFGICCDSKKECRDKLKNKVGYYDSLKYRFIVSQWSDSDLEEHKKFLEEKKKKKEDKRKEMTYRKECHTWVEEHKCQLNDEWFYKFEAGYYPNIKVKKSALEQWLNKPERIKK